MCPATRAEFEVAIICALPLEASAVLDLFDEHYDDDGDIYGRQEGDSNAYSTGRIGQHDIVLAHMPGMGKPSAASVASGLRSSFTGVKIALIVGVCGGVPVSSPDEPIILGDVIISNSVIQSDFGSQYPGHFERKSTVKDTLGRPNTDIRALLNKLEVRRVREKLGDKILQNLFKLREKNDTACYPGVNQDRLFAATHRHMHREESSSRDCLCLKAHCHSDPVCKQASESSCDALGCNSLAIMDNPARLKRLDAENPPPLVHIGIVGSADTVMKSGEHRDHIAQRDNIIAFEMEGAGVWDNLPCVIIKGVCDYADSHKNKRWQGYAAATAASAAKSFLDYWSPKQCFIELGRTSHGKRSYSPSGANENSKRARYDPPLDRQNLASTSNGAQADVGAQSDSATTVSDMRQLKLDALNFEQLDARHATIKKTHTGTCKWLFSKSEYLDWQDEQKLDEHHGFLWIKGKPGAGKSAIMKFAYADAEAKAKATDSAVISYFFNARGEHLEKSTCGMYRSLLFQLLNEVPRLQTVLDANKSNLKDIILNVESLQSLFRQAVERLDDTHLTCFVDALDECENSEDQVREMVNFFEELGEHTVENRIRFLVCFSSRHYPHITINKSVELILEVQPGHVEDITKYIQSNLKAGKSERVEKLKIEVQEKSQGIFLWVVLVVPMLQKAWNRGKVETLKQCLHDIPEDLNKLFKDILCRDTEDMEGLVLCLKWILYAGRPLRPEELHFAILSGTNPELLADSVDVTLADISRSILSSSKGLAEPTKTKAPTVQFIHESVRDFLLKENGLALIQNHFHNTSAGSAHDQLKQCCQHYINSAAINQSKDSSSEAITRFPFLEYSIRHIFKHAELAASHMISQEVFLADFALDSWIILYNIVEKHKIRRYSPQTSLLYVLVEQSTLHLCRIEICRSRKSINTESGGRYVFPIIAAAALDDQQILELLIQNDADFNSECKEYGNALHVAMEKGHTSGVNTLVKLGLSAQFQSQSRWRNFLHQAVRKSRIQIVRLLLDSHPLWLNSLFQGRPSNDPVREAFGSDDTQMVETFLGRFRDVRYHEDALRIASEVGKHSIVLALLDFGANLDACSLALPSAAHGGYKEIVRLLLDRGANINAFCEGSDSMGTALQVASRDGYETMVRMLLDRGADVNVLGGYYGTALQAASTIGHEAIVRMLLDADADLNASSGSSMCTALQTASRIGRETIVRMLLDGGADVNVLGGHYGTALQTASTIGHEAIVRMLLDADADINASSGILMCTALYAASENGHEAIVRLLLDHGADVDNLLYPSRKPLHAALVRGYPEVVSLLLEYGADMDTPSEVYPNALAAAEACSYKEDRATLKQILFNEERKRQPEPYLVWVDGIAYLNCQ
ncbi:purine and uridine phosphorylase [Aureobasidium pullulans]|uniref:Purine and uridine phosphorylase n=1 Tax=Aureobasidium pullulans TaxID=5580 RepID=A0A4S8YUM2_AURPU|nr:purine and uridine phosphorylase [Aureobasidium pullulans]